MRVKLPLAVTLLAFAAACSSTTDPSSDPDILPAFETAPYGMSNLSTTFGVSADQESSPWMPGMHGRETRPMGFMMGGLGGGFDGHPFGPSFGNRPPNEGESSARCTFDSGSGRVVCDPITRGGLTINKSAQFKDAAGNVQQAFDNQTTNSINTQISVTGTADRRNGATSAVDDHSDRTVTGLAQGSTQRTVNGTSHGHELTTGSNDHGDFSLERTADESVQGLVIPVGSDGHPSFPTAGTITRSMTVTLTKAGADPRTMTRTEVITYNGTDTATIVITHNGETKTCTLPLPHGRPSCS